MEVVNAVVALLMLFAAKAFEVEDLPSSPAEQKILPNTTNTKIALSLGQGVAYKKQSTMSGCDWRFVHMRRESNKQI
nr:hypothetical protein [Tanacetum cinerariifolium]